MLFLLLLTFDSSFLAAYKNLYDANKHTLKNIRNFKILNIIKKNLAFFFCNGVFRILPCEIRAI